MVYKVIRGVKFQSQIKRMSGSYMGHTKISKV